MKVTIPITIEVDKKFVKDVLASYILNRLKTLSIIDTDFEKTWSASDPIDYIDCEDEDRISIKNKYSATHVTVPQEIVSLIKAYDDLA